MIVGIRRIAPAIGIAATLVSSGIEAQSGPPNSYGTAFAVTKDGDLVTNAHVVAGCTAVTARLGATEFQGNVVVRDDNDDLALVHLSNQSTHFAFLRKRPEVRVGDTAITFGFPLPNALSHDGNLTVGYVSSLAGVSDNPTYFQVSTPIQPGSSGGSLLDSGGNVIGVVAKRMNPEKFPSKGDTAQLVNFAVSLKVLRTFLDRNKIALTERDSSKGLSVADVGDEARLFSYSVRCAPNNQMSTAKPSGAETQSDDTSERAVLYEEDLADGHGRRFVGSVAWRIEPLSAQGAHGSRILRGDIHFLGQLDVILIVSESLGENRPANCKIEVTFDTAQSARGSDRERTRGSYENW
ncbi:MAG: serine protease [Xanthobacteraceae bacterium]|nr:serine protease [Xanthobacteraceae bacterium]